MKNSNKYLISLIIFSILFAAVLGFDIFIIVSIAKNVWFLVFGGIALALIFSAVALLFLIIVIFLAIKYSKHKKLEKLAEE